MEILRVVENRFNGFRREMPKTVQTVFCVVSRPGTGLKPGVNEMTLGQRFVAPLFVRAGLRFLREAGNVPAAFDIFEKAQTFEEPA